MTGAPPRDWQPCRDHIWERKSYQGVFGMANDFWQCARCGVHVGKEAGEV